MNKKSIYLLYSFVFLFFFFMFEIIFLNAVYAPNDKALRMKNNFVKFTNSTNLTMAIEDNTIKLRS
ncbi:hypothetical protein [Sulfurimonas sp.]|uniref:hypothetical protein n=1 Tax=Sulfurimonas sp. TaxID=2022749 RepID=UPI00262BF9E9|nr:hypothetical protein [Sulfurimonas sp.]